MDDKTMMDDRSFSATDHRSETCASKVNEAMEQKVYAQYAGHALTSEDEAAYDIPEEDPGDNISNSQVPGDVHFSNSLPGNSDIDTDCEHSYNEDQGGFDGERGGGAYTENTQSYEGNPNEHEILDPIVRQQRQWKRLCERRNANLTYTMEEVAKHNSVHDCWLVAHGKVYDVTPMLFEHPAGVRSILRHAGGDSSIDFDFHSNGARKMWKQYEIGKLEGWNSSCLIM